MDRTTAIYRAKEAYRLFITRGIQTKGVDLASYPEGYSIKLGYQWTVILANKGKLVKAVHHKGN